MAIIFGAKTIAEVDLIERRLILGSKMWSQLRKFPLSRNLFPEKIVGVGETVTSSAKGSLQGYSNHSIESTKSVHLLVHFPALHSAPHSVERFSGEWALSRVGKIRESPPFRGWCCREAGAGEERRVAVEEEKTRRRRRRKEEEKG
mmetsp:Transcript_2618/g.6002  ORF Transcript_2618/g.6002 Transcript_2618/m.6002 type:complete len:146 (-) Transcript_2618:52-489(-)